MSDTEDNPVTTLATRIPPTLSNLCQQITQADVLNFVDSISFNTNNQSIILNLLRLLREEGENLERRRFMNEDSYFVKFRKLSEKCKYRYPELQRHFEKWQRCRQSLIENMETSSDKLDKISSFTSKCRIFTSITDIFGTVMRYKGFFSDPLADLLLETVQIGSFFVFLPEKFVCRRISTSVKEAIGKDKQFFENIVQWFKQFQELDETVRSYFPYGINKDMVKKIDTWSDKFDNYEKIFIAAFISNVKENPKLLKNADFLFTAESFARSEFGKLWFQKVLLESDPDFAHIFNSALYSEIETLMKISPTENPELFVDAVRLMLPRLFPVEDKTKLIFDTMTIILSGCKLWLIKKPQESEDLKNLLENAKEELEEIGNVVRLLKPSESPLGTHSTTNLNL